MVGLGIMAYGGMGLFLVDQAEKKWDLKPTERDHERLQEDFQRVRDYFPKITVVDKPNR